MTGKHTLASSAALLADPARAAMMTALLDGRASPAGELARTANVSAQSASMHLSQLLDGGFVEVAQQGRHRYYSIASPDVAHAVESLGAIATIRKRKPLGEDEAICYARTCYDHLAGRLAVQLANAFEEQLLLVAEPHDYRITARGREFLASWQIDTDVLRDTRRAFARRCLDWTERRSHIAGALGAAICSQLFAFGWIKRLPRTRAVRLTARGNEHLETLIGRQERTPDRAESEKKR